MRLPYVPAGMSVTVWPPVLATRGPGSRSDVHSHHALHFVLSLSSELRVRASPSGAWSTGAGVLTAPDAPHAIDSLGGEVLLVFLDPESDAGATFRPALERPIRILSSRERSALVRDVVPRTILRSGAEAWVRNAARALGVPLPASPRAIHPRVRRLLQILRSSGVDDATSLEVLARHVGLSPSRLMHVFTASIGIPLRPYLSWLRLQRAAIAIVNGAALGDAAHGAGFADAAHMTRTFRRMLGVPPSVLRPMRCSQEPRSDAAGEAPAPAPAGSRRR
jgi:AraC-like DNA-binding protein